MGKARGITAMRHIITSKPPMTLEQFEAEFKQLLRECEDAGLDVEEFCQLAEAILEQGWSQA